MKRIEIFLKASALILIVTSCGHKQESNEPTAPQVYPTMVLQKQSTDLLSVYPATIRGRQDIDIRPRIDGFIDDVYVDEGSVVKKGQQLFKINSPQSEQALVTAEASVANAEALANKAKIDVDRMRPLAEKDIIGKVQLESIENVYHSSLAALKQAKAALINAQATISWTNVTSPVDGVVGTIPYRLGSLVNSANVLTTVANTNSVFAYFSLNEKELSAFLDILEGKTQVEKLKNVLPVILTLADGTTYPDKGKIETITGVLDITTGSANLRAEFPNGQGYLKSGTSGKVSIPRSLDNVFVIPQKATFAQQDKVLVFRVQGDSVVQQVISVTSTPDGQHYAVTGGLNSGDRIVTDGIATLSKGQKISFQ